MREPTLRLFSTRPLVSPTPPGPSATVVLSLRTLKSLLVRLTEDREIFVTFSGSNVPGKVWLTRAAAGGEVQTKITEGVLVPRVVILSEEDGAWGDMVMVEGLGFENGGTLHFFVDKYVGDTVNAQGMRTYGQDGVLNSGEDVLCSVPTISGNAW